MSKSPIFRTCKLCKHSRKLEETGCLDTFRTLVVAGTQQLADALHYTVPDTHTELTHSSQPFYNSQNKPHTDTPPNCFATLPEANSQTAAKTNTQWQTRWISMRLKSFQRRHTCLTARFKRWQSSSRRASIHLSLQVLASALHQRSLTFVGLKVLKWWLQTMLKTQYERCAGDTFKHTFVHRCLDSQGPRSSPTSMHQYGGCRANILPQCAGHIGAKANGQVRCFPKRGWPAPPKRLGGRPDL